MSLFGLQTAITSLIRLPKQNRGDLETLLNGFDLTPSERAAAKALASDAELNKYGNELADQRFDRICRKIRPLFHFIERGAVADIWFEQFEPLATRVPSDMDGADAFSLAFLEYLLSAAGRRALAPHAPPFLTDLLRYFHAECWVRRPVGDQRPLPDDALLRHRNVSIARLCHDIPALLTQVIKKAAPGANASAPGHGLDHDSKRDHKHAESHEHEHEEGLSSLKPDARPMTLLMLRDGYDNIRMFEVEAAVGDFIEAELSGATHAPLSDELYVHLVKLGLCLDQPERTMH